MGWLHIARLDHGDNVPLLPVDVADLADAIASDEAMSLLHESGRGSFPTRGYPQALIQAHEHARHGRIGNRDAGRNAVGNRVRERNPAVARTAQAT